MGHVSVYMKGSTLWMRDLHSGLSGHGKEGKMMGKKEYQSGSPISSKQLGDCKQVTEGLKFLICKCSIGLHGLEVPSEPETAWSLTCLNA